MNDYSKFISSFQLQHNSKYLGVRFTPFPNNEDNIPETFSKKFIQCHSCNSFYNKYNNLISEYTYQCSICGALNYFDGFSSNSKDDPMFISPIYEQGHLTSDFQVRPRFIPTDFFFISSSLLSSDKFLEFIHKTLHYDPRLKLLTDNLRQAGICILHGNLTVAQYRPRFQLKTYIDSTPFTNFSTLFHTIPEFISKLPILTKFQFPHSSKPSLSSLDIFNFIIELSSKYGTITHLFLDENDIQFFETLPNVSESAVYLLERSVQISLSFITDFSPANHPLYILPILTGGYIKQYTKNLELIHNSFLPGNDTLFNNQYFGTPYFFNDTIIYAFGPNSSSIMDYAGPGFIAQTNKVILSKIAPMQNFFFSFNTSEKRKFIQFTVVYTTSLSSRRIRIFTFPISKICMNSLENNFRCCSAFLSQAVLISGEKLALEKLKKMKSSEKLNVSYLSSLIQPLTLNSIELLVNVRNGHEYMITTKEPFSCSSIV